MYQAIGWWGEKTANWGKSFLRKSTYRDTQRLMSDLGDPTIIPTGHLLTSYK